MSLMREFDTRARLRKHPAWITNAVVFGLFQSEKAGFLFSGQRRVGETRDIMKEGETGLQMFSLGGPDCSSFQNQTSRNHKQTS